VIYVWPFARQMLLGALSDTANAYALSNVSEPRFVVLAVNR
jgi:hypothetical protein